MNPYTALLRSNRTFRTLWLGQIVSQLGDWFNAVAVYALLLALTHSATAVAWMMITQFLPLALMGPVAGIVVDRVDRRRLMIGADLLRGVLMLGLLFVQRPDQIWIAYVVMAASVAATAFFEPARTASLPNITSAEELLPANALSSATWSAMLAIGAGLGGAVTALVGREAAFLVNSASFFGSAVLISRARFTSAPAPTAAAGARTWPSLLGMDDLVEGFRYVRSRPHVAALIFVKTGWGIAGGALLLLTIFGERVFPVAGSAAAGIGILYGARGIGAGLGPILARSIIGEQPRTLRRAIAPGYFMVSIFYIALAGTSTVWLAALAVVGAHTGGSIPWVFSTVLLQLEVPDRFRGRVFAAELALVTLMSSASSFLTAYAIEHAGWSPRRLSFILGLLFSVPGAIWLLIESRWQASGLEAAPAAEATGDEILQGRIG